MSVSHAHFHSFRIIFTFQCSSPAVLDIITPDSDRLFVPVADREQVFSVYRLHTLYVFKRGKITKKCKRWNVYIKKHEEIVSLLEILEQFKPIKITFRICYWGR